MRVTPWACVLVAFAFGRTAQALHFYLRGAEQRCFLEELPSDTIVEGHYKALEWVEESKEWQVNEKLGVTVIVEEVASGENVASVHGQSEGKFTFTSHEPGDHSICLRSNSTSSLFTTTHIKFYLDIIVGSSKKDAGEDETHITTLTTKLRDLNEKVGAIRREQQYQREVEVTFRNASEKTNSRAVWWSMVQIAFLIGVSYAQMRYLRSYFEVKKTR